MSFFKLSDGQDVNTDGTMDMGGGDFPPIPANTNVLAAISETKVDEYQGERYINNAWTVLAPDEHKNRKIFQKLRVYDNDPNKKDKAIRMLAAIDANCGGKLVASGQEPTDQLLAQCLLNKPMACNLQVWELDDKSKRGNWISKVAPRKANGAAQPEPVQQTAAPSLADMDDSIPF